jgi:hypothetical protein
MALGFEEMRTQFGTRLSRFLRGGVVLSALEGWTLQSLVSSLPPDLQQIVEHPINRVDELLPWNLAAQIKPAEQS